LLTILVMNNMVMKLFMLLIEYICGAPEPIYQESNDQEPNDQEPNDYFLYDLESLEMCSLYK